MIRQQYWLRLLKKSRKGDRLKVLRNRAKEEDDMGNGVLVNSWETAEIALSQMRFPVLVRAFSTMGGSQWILNEGDDLKQKIRVALDASPVGQIKISPN